MHTWNAEEYHLNSSIQMDAAFHLVRSRKWRDDERVLDVGCGDGKVSAKIASLVPKGSVLGIDISKEMIQYASGNFTKNDFPNLSFIALDAEKINYANEFEVIFSSFAIQWIKDLNAFLSKAYRSLVSSGLLLITVPLGISEALEQAISLLTISSKWAPYFSGFELGVTLSTEKRYKDLLDQNRFITTVFDVVVQTKIFSSREEFEKYVIQWFVYLKALPDDLKLPFFTEIIDKYLELEPPLSGGRVVFKFKRLDILASKKGF